MNRIIVRLLKSFSNSLKPAPILLILDAGKANANPLVWAVKSHRAGYQFDMLRLEFEGLVQNGIGCSVIVRGSSYGHLKISSNLVLAIRRICMDEWIRNINRERKSIFISLPAPTVNQRNFHTTIFRENSGLHLSKQFVLSDCFVLSWTFSNVDSALSEM